MSFGTEPEGWSGWVQISVLSPPSHSEKSVFIWNKFRLHLNMPGRGRPNRAISVQKVRRCVTPPHFRNMQFLAAVCFTSAPSEVRLGA